MNLYVSLSPTAFVAVNLINVFPSSSSSELKLNEEAILPFLNTSYLYSTSSSSISCSILTKFSSSNLITNLISTSSSSSSTSFLPKTSYSTPSITAKALISYSTSSSLSP